MTILSNLIRQKNLAIALTLSWIVIGLVGEHMLIVYLNVSTLLSYKCVSIMQGLIALLFVFVYEYTLKDE